MLLKVIEVDSKRRWLVLSVKKVQKEPWQQRLRELKLLVEATSDVEIVGAGVDRERVSLSRKDLLPSSWELIEQHHNKVDRDESVMTSVAEFGVFALMDDVIEVR